MAQKASGGYERYLVCSSVIDGVGESAALTKELRDAGVAHLHFTLGLIQKETRVQANRTWLDSLIDVQCLGIGWSHLVDCNQERLSGDSNGLEFHIGPAFINPNRSEVVRAIVDAYKQTKLDSEWTDIDAWYRKHQRLRCSNGILAQGT